MKTSELLFMILRSEISGTLIDADTCKDYDPKSLYKMAKAHDLMYCVTDALGKVDLLPKEQKCFDVYDKELVMSTVRIVSIEDTLKRIKTVLNDAKIPFVPLKGAVIRGLYPDELMRASCDIDVLVKEEDVDRAVLALKDQGFKQKGPKNFHDISLYYGIVHLELHFSICENMKDMDPLLQRVWEYVEPFSGYEFREKKEYFVFHHIAHMKYHFMNGGCGIRPFLDLYIMKKEKLYEEDKLIELLDCTDLTAFYKSVLSVISVWFENGKATETTAKCEEYILQGGVYGTVENNIAAQSSLKNGKLRLIWHSIFLPYNTMCILYPKLKKKKFLLPYYYIVRIFEKTFTRKGKASRKKFKDILMQDRDKINSIDELMSAMGIKRGKAI